MELLGVRLELPANAPVVLLREQAGERRVLPIYIGPEEAKAIALALEGVVTPRPMSHDLMRDLVVSLGAEVQRVVVTELRDSTFFAEIELSVAGAVQRVSSRPSDAIALAVRATVPIFADEEVLDEAGIEIEDDDEQEVEQFKEFLDSVTPEDFRE